MTISRSSSAGSSAGPGAVADAPDLHGRAIEPKMPAALGARAGRLLVVANRLPVQRVKQGGGDAWVASPGGLVSALTPIIEERGGAWVGWTGAPGPAPKIAPALGMDLHAVPLSAGEIETFYLGFSNRTLWPLYHDAVRTPEFHRSWWSAYEDVNRRFAERIAEVAQSGDLVWVQDYHLQLLPAMLRELRPDVRIGFFLHIPFPAPELFARLPWRAQIVQGLLGADLVGFQTRFWARNFVRAAEQFASVRSSRGGVLVGDRTVSVGAFPISIDWRRFDDLAADPKVIARAAALRKRLGEDRRVYLGVDRLDYTKGIDVRLRAFAEMLRRKRATAESAVLVQVAVPSREEVGEYRETRSRIEELAGQINGEYAEPGRLPIHYFRRSLDQPELVAHYLAADVMLVTPLRDGMNLVAKEYVACRRDNTGALVLSEFAGAAHELRSAIHVNPYDIDGCASAFEEAFAMGDRERSTRMRSLRRAVRRADVFDWARAFTEACLP